MLLACAVAVFLAHTGVIDLNAAQSQGREAPGVASSVAGRIADRLATKAIIDHALRSARFEEAAGLWLLDDLSRSPDIALALPVVLAYAGSEATQDSAIDLLNVSLEIATKVASGLEKDAEYVGNIVKVGAFRASVDREVWKTDAAIITKNEISKNNLVTPQVAARAKRLAVKLSAARSADFSAARNALRTAIGVALTKAPDSLRELAEREKVPDEISKSRARVSALLK
jgi:hypothetical protein